LPRSASAAAASAAARRARSAAPAAASAAAAAAAAQLARVVRLRAPRGGLRVCQAALRALGWVTGDPGWSTACLARACGDLVELTPCCVHTEAGSHTAGVVDGSPCRRLLCVSQRR